MKGFVYRTLRKTGEILSNLENYYKEAGREKTKFEIATEGYIEQQKLYWEEEFKSMTRNEQVEFLRTLEGLKRKKGSGK